MKRYLDNEKCQMQFLAEALDDAHAGTCGRCAVCLGRPVMPIESASGTLSRAQRFMRQADMPLELKRRWDIDALAHYSAAFRWTKHSIPAALQGKEGRILSRWGEPVWGEKVARGKAVGRFDDDLLEATVDLVRNRWKGIPPLSWVTCMPSIRNPRLVDEFASRLALALGIPFRTALRKTRETAPQKTMENRFHRCANLDGIFDVQSQNCMPGPVLLVDDVVDSGWTLTLGAALLRQAGVNEVVPFALATTAAK